MFRSWIAGLAVGAAVAVAPAIAADGNPLNIPAGAAIRMTVEETSDGIGVKATYRLALTPSAGAWKVQIKLENATLTGSGPQASAMLSSVNMLNEARYDADAGLRPVRLFGMENAVAQAAQISASRNGEDLSAEDKAALQAMVSAMLPKVTPETAAQSYLGPFQIAAGPQTSALTLNQPVTSVAQIPAPTGKGTIKVNRSYVLKDAGGAGRPAIVELNEAFDPESARQMVRELMGALMGPLLAQAGPDAEEVQAQLNAMMDGMSVENTTSCRYEMDTATGLTTKVTCDRRSRMSMPGSPPQDTTSRLVVTQVVVKP